MEDSRKELKPGDKFIGLTYLGGGYYVSDRTVAETLEELRKESKLSQQPPKIEIKKNRLF